MKDLEPYSRRGSGLVDVLDRVLDKGLVVAGDIKVSLAEVELLTIRVRLLVCSIDKAEQIGLDWWRHEPHFSGLDKAGAGSDKTLQRENAALKEQVSLLEQRLAALEGRAPASARRAQPVALAGTLGRAPAAIRRGKKTLDETRDVAASGRTTSRPKSTKKKAQNTSKQTAKQE